jgi:Carboxylesterase family
MGNLRFAKPIPPANESKIQDRYRKGNSCPPLSSLKLISNVVDEVLPASLRGLLSNLMSGIDLASIIPSDPTSEDCLFLDIVVPGKALRKEVKLPVINWIYGGGFVEGSKEDTYDGLPIVKASSNNVIYVAGNYRLGPFGFLGGETVEKDKYAVANAGLHDQRAVLEWIQQNVELFGGDPNNVSAWVGLHLSIQSRDLALT